MVFYQILWFSFTPLQQLFQCGYLVFSFYSKPFRLCFLKRMMNKLVIMKIFLSIYSAHVLVLDCMFFHWREIFWFWKKFRCLESFLFSIYCCCLFICFLNTMIILKMKFILLDSFLIKIFLLLLEFVFIYFWINILWFQYAVIWKI